MKKSRLSSETAGFPIFNKENVTLKYGFIVYERPVEECFDYASRNGIHHLEIDLRRKHSRIDTFDPHRVYTIAQLSRENEISLSLHPPYNLNLCAKGPFMRRYYKAFLGKCVHLAHDLGAGYITLHLGSFVRSAMWASPRQQALDRLIKLLRKVLPICEEKGVILALENVVPLSPEKGYAFLGDNIEDFQYIYFHLESPYLKFCLDIGHAHTAEGPLVYVSKLGDKIRAVHFHDNRGKYDDHLTVGQGSVPWRELLPALHNTGFRGPYVSECFKSSHHEAIAELKKHFPHTR